MNKLKINISTIALLMLAGCVVVKFEPLELSDSNWEFISEYPPECMESKLLSCIEKINPAWKCKDRDKITNTGPIIKECVAEVYPQCYNSERNTIIQSCIKNLADQREKDIQEFNIKLQKEKEAKEKEKAAVEYKKLLEKERAQAEYEKTPEGMAKRKAWEDSYRKAGAACVYFLNDLVNTTNFIKGKIINEPVLIMSTVVSCVYSGYVSEVYGERPVVIQLKGNIKTGVYEYR